MGKIAGIVHFTDHLFRRGNAAGGKYLIVRILPHRDFCPENTAFVCLLLRPDLHQDSGFQNAAHLLVSMSDTVLGHTDQPGLLQLSDMAGQRAVGDLQPGCDLIHIHFFFF